MIIKSTRIKTKSGTKNITNHLLNKPEDNEVIKVLHGDESDFETFHQFADEDKTMYSLRHFSINPGQKWTNKQMSETIDKIREEYGAKDRPYFAVGHSKKLADGSDNKHIHLVIPERFSGKTLDNKFAYQRNEKISRMCEYDFKHEITTGKHNKSVGHALENDEKYKELSEIMLEVHATKPRPKAAYSSNDLQIAKRQGIDLPKSKIEIKDIHSRSDNYQSFEAGLKESGYQIKMGEKAHIIEKDGTFIGSANRLLKMKKSDFEQFMKGNNYENNSKRHKEGHNRNIRTRSTPRGTKQNRRDDRTNGSNESQNRRTEKRNIKPERIDERNIQENKLMTFSEIKILNDINNSENIFKIKNEIKNNNNLLKNISKFFKSIFKDESKINQKDLDDLNEIDNMSDDQKIMYKFTSNELENEIFNPTKTDIETQKTEPTKPEPPKPESPMAKYETPKIGRMSDKKSDRKQKKPSVSIGSDTPVNLNSKLMEDVTRDRDLQPAPKPF
ncbi:hypothetical protein ABIE64_000396 [Thalassospira sp. MBR-102]|uniref:relaxase/mobilization nuclease domain-containing protein n=1 Tax=Thalassospira sp. MBR-102 TaxID=3156466 RepID=UPI0033962D47